MSAENDPSPGSREAGITDDVPPADPPRRRRGSAGVVVVAALAGLLFVTNASSFDAEDAHRPGSLVELARAEADRLNATVAEVAELREQIDDHLAAQDAYEETPVDPLVAHAAAREPVRGTGVVVELWDAPEPVNFDGSGFHSDDLVVHQQDLEAVMNALWAGGAEAMMVQDQRITSTSAVRCVGNVLLLHGRHYSPPYRVSAIGDPELLQRALDSSPGVYAYLQHVEAINLGWSVSHEDEIEMPAYTGRTRMEHASVPVSYAESDDETRSDDGDD